MSAGDNRAAKVTFLEGLSFTASFQTNWFSLYSIVPQVGKQLYFLILDDAKQ